MTLKKVPAAGHGSVIETIAHDCNGSFFFENKYRFFIIYMYMTICPGGRPGGTPGYPGVHPGYPRGTPGVSQDDFPRKKIQNRKAILNFFRSFWLLFLFLIYLWMLSIVFLLEIFFIARWKPDTWFSLNFICIDVLIITYL